MDWKVENPKPRFIDGITDDEAHKIAFLATGQPDELKVLSVERKTNGNNIPHVVIHVVHWEPVLCEEHVTSVGVFDNLDTYLGNHFHKPYCQKELFKYYTEIGLD